MKREFEISDWQDFETKLQDLYRELTSLKGKKSFQLSNLFFRGQPNLELKTTLERYAVDNISLLEYYRIISIAKIQVETFTGHTWEIPSLEEFEKQLSNLDLYFIEKTISTQIFIHIWHI